MLLTIHHAIRRMPVALCAAALLIGPSTAAAEDCPEQPTTQAFLPWGDPAEYAVAPNGDFETGTAGWSLFNARTVAGNEDADILPGERALALGTGWLSGPAVVSTAEFCVSDRHPYFRYMLKARGAVGLLATFISYRTSTGSVVQQQVASNLSTNLFPGTWKPSSLNPLSINLPISDGETMYARLIFVSPMSLGGPSYLIDNVMIDPYRRG